MPLAPPHRPSQPSHGKLRMVRAMTAPQTGPQAPGQAASEPPPVYAQWVWAEIPGATDVKVASLWRSESAGSRQFWTNLVVTLADLAIDAAAGAAAAPPVGLLCDNKPVMDALMLALSDPGSYLPRAPLESLTSWQRRAIVEHVAPLIIAATSGTERPDHD